MNIGNDTFEEYQKKAKEFHGYPGPGLLVGGVMAELAKSKLPKGLRYNALSETSHCLPDAIMLTTPCTVGNNRLKILDFGRYALSLYDKESGHGIRVHIHLENVKENFPVIYTWFMKLVPKKEQDNQLLNEELSRFTADMLIATEVVLSKDFLNQSVKSKTHLCDQCGEPFPMLHGTTCRACAGQSPYVISK